jgi:CO/xanthine dehydrogenase FAD-binding subunit
MGFAGGHSLVPLMKLRLSEPKKLIDIARIPELAGTCEKDGKVEIGAGTVHHDVATSPLLRERCLVLADCAAEIGDPQIRNRGTLGGSCMPTLRPITRRSCSPLTLKFNSGDRRGRAPWQRTISSPTRTPITLNHAIDQKIL